ncbi:hypothetical protein [Nocardioides alkalitolerans]|uniref:hypothetical protein n=1 Tax=Nocardioides alkalitolerans TaxID=281714 RepID=UPI00048F8A7E|nr:hypothetical protein [Nocardioides alkalitolerans]
MKTSVTALLASTALLLTACAGADESEDRRVAPTQDVTSSAATGDDRIWPSGNALSTYRDNESYPWRVSIVDNEGALLTGMQSVSSHLEQRDLSDVLNTCDAISRGIGGDQLVDQTIQRFSGSVAVDAAQAAELIELTRDFACPDL